MGNWLDSLLLVAVQISSSTDFNWVNGYFSVLALTHTDNMQFLIWHSSQNVKIPNFLESSLHGGSKTYGSNIKENIAKISPHRLSSGSMWVPRSTRSGHWFATYWHWFHTPEYRSVTLLLHFFQAYSHFMCDLSTFWHFTTWKCHELYCIIIREV